MSVGPDGNVKISGNDGNGNSADVNVGKGGDVNVSASASSGEPHQMKPQRIPPHQLTTKLALQLLLIRQKAN